MCQKSLRKKRKKNYYRIGSNLLIEDLGTETSINPNPKKILIAEYGSNLPIGEKKENIYKSETQKKPKLKKKCSNLLIRGTR